MMFKVANLQTNFEHALHNQGMLCACSLHALFWHLPSIFVSSIVLV